MLYKTYSRLWMNGFYVTSIVTLCLESCVVCACVHVVKGGVCVCLCMPVYTNVYVRVCVLAVEYDACV
jgi:hypothetical protein